MLHYYQLRLNKTAPANNKHVYSHLSIYLYLSIYLSISTSPCVCLEEITWRGGEFDGADDTNYQMLKMLQFCTDTYLTFVVNMYDWTCMIEHVWLDMYDWMCLTLVIIIGRIMTCSDDVCADVVLMLYWCILYTHPRLQVHCYYYLLN